ncbi:hypothetical protein ASJ81_08165 [Methanosarcina spelaei]|uniref:Uncharacterized protein n=1 Tax=Methanosarcina spelaei TaxID=1036679 RepID=A0A2A2HR63_9EURY|nr:hypothetical protein ASJ81_08165 [Methanosarcina spelaei]
MEKLIFNSFGTYFPKFVSDHSAVIITILKKLPTNIFRTDLIKNDVANMITTLFKKCLSANFFKKSLIKNP